MSSSSTSTPIQNPFRLSLRARWLARLLERLLGLNRLQDIYERSRRGADPVSFLSGVLEAMDVHLEVIDEYGVLGQIQDLGPLLVVANHPLGGLDGVALTRLLLHSRPDTQVLTNEILLRIPELEPVFIGVDVLSGSNAENLHGLRRALRHLKSDGSLLVFPAGKVAQYQFSRREIIDHPWNRLAGQLARKSQATCLPIYIEGRNSRFFYFMAMLSPLLRTLLLPRELGNKMGGTLRVRIGKPVVAQEYQRLENDEAVTGYLRMATEFLRERSRGMREQLITTVPVIEAFADVSADLDAMQDCLLIRGDTFDVYCAPYQRLGGIATHLGVAREITFRAAGEGTGNSIDSDRFDAHYLHLFIWDRGEHRLVGGYRIGRTMEVVEKHGLDALYSRTLYQFDRKYLEKIGAPLEMGRSFIHPDYQRHTLVLDLLWRGIGTYVARNPEFHTLFGAVSISREHSDLARALISECMLESFCAEQRFLEDVKPVVPLEVDGRVWDQSMLAELKNVSLLNKLVGRCDPGMTVPTLLRHYLSLNGRFVCFSLNRVFSDSLDGLILVDLRKTPRKYLNRYLSKQGAEDFLNYWANSDS